MEIIKYLELKDNKGQRATLSWQLPKYTLLLKDISLVIIKE